jgi:hypothetical protein
METNNLFSIQRFMLLCKQSLIINKKLIGISLAGFTGTLFILLILLQSANNNFRNWDNSRYMATFLFLFFSLGIIYSSLSFPSFRSKEKSMAYLMLPTSASEKFVFELLTRIVLFIIIMPLLFWVVANLEGMIVKEYVPRFTNYKFSFGEGLAKMFENEKIGNWAKLAIAQGCLFVFIAALTGASHFSKSPLLKTLFSITLIVGGYGLFIYLLVKGLDLNMYHPVNDRVLMIHNGQEAIKYLAIAGTVINLSFLSIAWFRLKDKEV